MGSSDTVLALFTGMPGWAEMMVIAGFGLLIFGRRLPEVGRSLGKGIVEFKRGLRGIEDEVEDAVDESEPRSRYLPPKEDETPKAKADEDATKAQAAE